MTFTTDELVTSRTGLTEQQEACWEARYCPAGHKFTSLNFPLPDGQCPMCADPAFAQDVFDARARGLTPDAETTTTLAEIETRAPSLPHGIREGLRRFLDRTDSRDLTLTLDLAQRLRRQRGRRPTRKDRA